MGILLFIAIILIAISIIYSKVLFDMGKQKLSCLMSVGIILAFLIFLIPEQTQKRSELVNSTKVCTVYKNRDSSKNVYYDNSCDKYFILNMSRWNFLNIYTKEYLDNDTVEKLIEAVDIINEFEY